VVVHPSKNTALKVKECSESLMPPPPPRELFCYSSTAQGVV